MQSGVLGWDMTAALALGHALGIASLVVAELIPAIEAVMVRKANEQIALSGPERLDP